MSTKILEFKTRKKLLKQTPVTWNVMFIREYDGGIIVELDEADFYNFEKQEMVDSLRILAEAIENGISPGMI